MSEYIAITKKLRYSILKRDGFKCHYCGAKAGDTKLEVDHIVPQSKGGTDEPSNLITICRDCNRGKSNRETEDVKQAVGSSAQEAEVLRMYFSGSEGKTHFECITSVGVPHTLVSFYPLFKHKAFDSIKKRKKENPELNFMVDSGAFTLINEDKDRSDEWYDSYIKAYAEWLEENKDYIQCAVELDIDSRVGLPQVAQWQREYFEPLEKKGLPIIYVWHKERGHSGWIQMCKDHAYCGVPGDVEDYTQLFAVARQYMTKVHGFGITSESLVVNYPFYSVDSISWKMGEIFGDSFFWNGREMHRYKDKKIRLQYRTQLENMGLDFGKIMSEDNREVTKMNLFAFKRMEADLNIRFVNRAYWHYRIPLMYTDGSISKDDAQYWYDKLQLATKLPDLSVEPSEENEQPLETSITILAIIQNGAWREIGKNDYADEESVQSFMDTFISAGYTMSDSESRNLARLFVNGKMMPGGTVAMTRSISDYKPAFSIFERQEESLEEDEEDITEEFQYTV